MSDFSKRARLVINEPTHSFNPASDTKFFSNYDWHCDIENEGSFKILTLKYHVRTKTITPLELLILESFSMLAESRKIDQVFNLTFRELENFLRDFNNTPSIPEVCLSQADLDFIKIKSDFFKFFLINEYFKDNSLEIRALDWPRMSLFQMAKKVSSALIVSSKFLGFIMPKRVIFASSSEIFLEKPEDISPISIEVLEHFFAGIGIRASLKLVAV